MAEAFASWLPGRDGRGGCGGGFDGREPARAAERTHDGRRGIQDGVSINIIRNLNERSLETFRDLSRKWHRFLGFEASEQRDNSDGAGYFLNQMYGGRQASCVLY